MTLSKAQRTIPRKRGVHQWVDVPQPKINRTNDRAIVTVAVGANALELSSWTTDSMRKYADRCHADFHVITGKTQSWPLLEKFRVKPYAEAYDQLLFLDVDCIVRDDCQNLFDRLETAFHNDWPELPADAWACNGWRGLMASQGAIDRPFVHGRMLNSGVVLCRREDAAMWTPPTHPVPGLHCDEQMWIESNLGVYGIEYGLLELRHNTQWYMPRVRSKEVLAQAEILHLAGCPWKNRPRLASLLRDSWEAGLDAVLDSMKVPQC